MPGRLPEVSVTWKPVMPPSRLPSSSPRPAGRPAVGNAEDENETESPGWAPKPAPPVGVVGEATPASVSWAETDVVAPAAGAPNTIAEAATPRAATPAIQRRPRRGEPLRDGRATGIRYSSDNQSIG